MRDTLRLNQLSENARQILLWFETSQSQSISTSCSLSSSLSILYVRVTVSQKRKLAGLFFCCCRSVDVVVIRLRFVRSCCIAFVKALMLFASFSVRAAC